MEPSLPQLANRVPRKQSSVNYRPWLRIGLIALAVPDSVVAGWLLLAPRTFYRNFPGFGHHWVSPRPLQ
jgi:hypothetical protein